MFALIASAVLAWGGAPVSTAGGPPGSNGLITVPGFRNPDVTAVNIHQTICNPGWSKTERLKLGSRANTLKKQAMAKYGIPWSKAPLLELDHDGSIEDGGSPTDVRNLSLQWYIGPHNAHQKDRIENKIHVLICSGKLTLDQGFGELTTNWITAYRKYVGPLP